MLIYSFVTCQCNTPQSQFWAHVNFYTSVGSGSSRRIAICMYYLHSSEPTIVNSARRSKNNTSFISHRSDLCKYTMHVYKNTAVVMVSYVAPESSTAKKKKKKMYATSNFSIFHF